MSSCWADGEILQSIKRLDVDFWEITGRPAALRPVLTHNPPYRQETRQTTSERLFGVSRKCLSGRRRRPKVGS